MVGGTGGDVSRQHAHRRRHRGGRSDGLGARERCGRQRGDPDQRGHLGQDRRRRRSRAQSARAPTSDADIRVDGARTSPPALRSRRLRARRTARSSVARGGDVADDSLTAADIAADAITVLRAGETAAVVGGTGGDVADDTLTAADLGANSVAASELGERRGRQRGILTNAVTSAKIADGTIAGVTGAGADLGSVTRATADIIADRQRYFFQLATARSSGGTAATSPTTRSPPDDIAADSHHLAPSSPTARSPAAPAATCPTTRSPPTISPPARSTTSELARRRRRERHRRRRIDNTSTVDDIATDGVGSRRDRRATRSASSELARTARSRAAPAATSPTTRSPPPTSPPTRSQLRARQRRGRGRHGGDVSDNTLTVDDLASGLRERREIAQQHDPRWRQPATSPTTRSRRTRSLRTRSPRASSPTTPSTTPRCPTTPSTAADIAGRRASPRLDELRCRRGRLASGCRHPACSAAEIGRDCPTTLDRVQTSARARSARPSTPRCRSARATKSRTSISDETTRRWLFNTRAFDTATMHEHSTNNSRLTATTAGLPDNDQRSTGPTTPEASGLSPEAERVRPRSRADRAM